MGVSSFNSSIGSVGFNYKAGKASNNIEKLNVNINQDSFFKYEVSKNNVVQNVDYNTLNEYDGNNSSSDNSNAFLDVGAAIITTPIEMYLSYSKGFFGVAENIVDAGALLFANIASAVGNEELSNNTQEFIQREWVQEGYDWVMENTTGGQVIDQYSMATDTMLELSEMGGTVVAYAAINAIPGGTAVSAGVAGLAAAGSAAQTTLQNGGTLMDANITAGVAAGTAVVSRYGLSGVQSLAQTVTTGTGVVLSAGAGAVVSEIEPVANNIAQYATWGNDLVDENGNKVYDSYLDYADKSGLGKQMLISGAAGAFTAGTTATKSYTATQNYRASVIEKSNAETPEQIAQVKKAAENTIDNVKNDYKNGVYNKRYSVGEILDDPAGNQLKYWSPEQAKAYYDDFGKYADANGNVKVYCFQNGDPGGNNLAKFGGSVGPGDGAFVTSEATYLEIIDDPTLFKKTVTATGTSYECIDAEKLSQRLGNVNLGSGNNVIAVEQTVRLDDISPPNAGNSCAYPGDWSPGGKTVSAITGRGDCIEGVVPQGHYSNGNVKIISHGAYSAGHYTSQL